MTVGVSCRAQHSFFALVNRWFVICPEIPDMTEAQVDQPLSCLHLLEFPSPTFNVWNPDDSVQLVIESNHHDLS